MRIVDQDEVGVVEKRASVEETGVCRYGYRRAGFVSCSVRRRETVLRSSKCDSIDSLAVTGLLDGLCDELLGGAQVDGTVSELCATPVGDQQAHQGFATTGRKLQREVKTGLMSSGICLKNFLLVWHHVRILALCKRLEMSGRVFGNILRERTRFECHLITPHLSGYWCFRLEGCVFRIG